MWSSLLNFCTEGACLVVWTSLSLAQCAVTVALCDTLSCDRWIAFCEICRRAQIHVLSIANVVLIEDWSWRPWSPQMWTVNNFFSRRWQPNSSIGSLWFTDWEAHLGLLSILPVIPIKCRPHPFRQDGRYEFAGNLQCNQLRLLSLSGNNLCFSSPALACLHFSCKWMSWSSRWDPSSSQ